MALSCLRSPHSTSETRRHGLSSALYWEAGRVRSGGESGREPARIGSTTLVVPDPRFGTTFPGRGTWGRPRIWWLCFDIRCAPRVSCLKTLKSALKYWDSTESISMVCWWRITSWSFCELRVYPEKPELGSAIIQWIASPTNHINDIVCLIRLHHKYYRTL